MHLFFTQSSFEYIHPIFKNKIKTKSSIPFFVNNNGELIDLVNNYLLVKCEQEWKDKSNTIKTNTQHLQSFLNYIENNLLSIEAVSFDVIDSYLENLKDNKLKENTIKNKILTVRSFYYWLTTYNLIKIDPFQNFSNHFVNKKINSFSKNNQNKIFQINNIKNKIIKDLKTEDIPTPEEIKILYKNLSNEYKLLFLCYISTGMRKNEVLQLTPDMILNAKDNGEGLSYSLYLDANKINIKNMKSRIVVLEGALRNKIIKHMRNKEYKRRLKLFTNKYLENAPVFISKQGNFYASNTLNSNFTKANTTSFNITVHSLRHYYATYFIRFKEKQGADIESAYLYLSQRLGHTNVDTTKEYYIKIVNKLKQQRDLEEYSSTLIEGIINA
jgi:site-specific recombinase XerD